MSITLILPGTRVGARTVLERVPAPERERGAAWYRVRCGCGRVQAVRAANLLRGRADRCRSCAATGRRAVHRMALELMVLALERHEIDASLVVLELGWTAQRAAAGMSSAWRRGMLERHRQGVYRLTRSGRAYLVDIADGRRGDRHGLAHEIRAAQGGDK